MKKIIILALVIGFTFSSCKKNETNFDATGTFEATETIISSEANGKIVALNILEGQNLEANQVIGAIDSLQLHLKKEQLLAQIKAILSKRPDAGKQIATLESQIATAKKEKTRFEKLVKAEAATTKQLDDIDAQIEMLSKQLEALQSSLSITTTGLQGETLPVFPQIAQLSDQLEKCKLVNPIKGTVLSKYAEKNEIAMQGKALYKIADLSNLTLRAYVTGVQLPTIKIGQEVKIFIDNGADKYKEMKGTITWISDKAEFTPKTIQTKEERANLVYALKINVANDGYLKIGMYGEVKF
ncbi:MAG: efflux RND transporter periplasmic adaptor subunit [Candidatus Kapabacteria bacterium]|nr:efflux RND transporter periplasmic adaptor subunit [Candidatus Kapabacteria bacterium]